MLVPLALVGPALGAWLSGDPTTWSRRVGASLLPLLGGALGFAAGVGFGLLVGGIGGLAAWGNLYGLVFGAAAGLQFSSFLCLPLALAGAIAGSVTASALIGSAPGVSETTEAQPSPTTPTLTVSPSRDGVSVGLQLRW